MHNLMSTTWWVSVAENLDNQDAEPSSSTLPITNAPILHLVALVRLAPARLTDPTKHSALKADRLPQNHLRTWKGLTQPSDHNQ